MRNYNHPATLVQHRDWAAFAQQAARATWRRIGIWRERARQRRALAKLDARQLDDIGKTRNQAVQEAARAFWR